ncbi:Eukaryotic translation initiation factor 4 gamma 1 [Stylophora pistillata]|uniref:Eukaryotic translation initiation factor 4 gamma 2 n=1 Tax=Stylophora pistillata TaxID=50429 RepID=A0A2B4S618_STYPI|nr:Eukaryotic translation initiation factor 4 gamma 1 [Stylophora pistillata]
MQKGKAAASPPAMVLSRGPPQQYPCYFIFRVNVMLVNTYESNPDLISVPRSITGQMPQNVVMGPLPNQMPGPPGQQSRMQNQPFYARHVRVPRHQTTNNPPMYSSPPTAPFVQFVGGAQGGPPPFMPPGQGPAQFMSSHVPEDAEEPEAEESKEEEEAAEEVPSEEETWEDKEESSFPDLDGEPERQDGGKLTYERDFLLKFQTNPMCMLKPEGLPDLEVVLGQPRTPSKSGYPNRMQPKDGGKNMFLPAYLRQNSRGNPSNSRTGRRNVQPKKVIDLAPKMTSTDQLKKTEKRWIRPSEVAKEGLSEEQIKTEEILRKVRSILNKLTPQKFQTLTKQIMDLEIDTPERLESAIDLIFEKAIDEPAFSVAYANMCRCLIPKKVAVEKDGSKKDVTFRTILLNKCQREFEKEKSVEKRIHEKLEELTSKGLSEEELEMKKKDLQDEETLVKRRTLGNIRFIGELFKLKMLTESIMHDCVVKLLKSNDEEAFECLCKLLVTIGKDLDHIKAKLDYGQIPGPPPMQYRHPQPMPGPFTTVSGPSQGPAPFVYTPQQTGYPVGQPQGPMYILRAPAPISPMQQYNPNQNVESRTRQKKIIQIKDPNSNKDVTQEILNRHTSGTVSGSASGSTGGTSTNTPDLSGQSSSSNTPPLTSQQQDLRAQFAAQVAATLNSDTDKNKKPGDVIIQKPSVNTKSTIDAAKLKDVADTSKDDLSKQTEISANITAATEPKLAEQPVEKNLVTQLKEEESKSRQHKEAAQGSKLGEGISVDTPLVSSVNAITATKGIISNVRVEIYTPEDLRNKEIQQSNASTSEVKPAVEPEEEVVKKPEVATEEEGKALNGPVVHSSEEVEETEETEEIITVDTNVEVEVPPVENVIEPAVDSNAADQDSQPAPKAEPTLEDSAEEVMPIAQESEGMEVEERANGHEAEAKTASVAKNSADVQGAVKDMKKKKQNKRLKDMEKRFSAKEVDLMDAYTEKPVKEEPRVDQYFAQILKIIQARITSARVRFMMQDIVDLRGNNWVPRREDNNPKTIDQIHKEAADAAKKTQLMIQMAKQDKKLRGNMGGRDSPRPSGGVPQADETWTTVGRGPKNVSVDPKRFQNIKRPVDSENISLGPGGRGFSSWARGSSGGTGAVGAGAGPTAASAAPPATSADDSRTTAGNRYSALAGERKYSAPARQNSGGSGRQEPRSPMGGGRRAPFGAGEREKALEAVRAVTQPKRNNQEREGGRESPRLTPEASSTPEAPSTPEPTSASVSPAPELTPEEMKKKANAIIEEYLAIKDMKEAVECVKELESPSTHYVFVTSAFNHTVEKSEASRKAIGRLFHFLFRDGVLTNEQYLAGVEPIMECAEDLEVDIPLLWKYLAEIMGPTAFDGNLNLDKLFLDCVLKHVSKRKGAKLFAHLLEIAANDTSREDVSAILSRFTVKLNVFFDSDEEAVEFAKDKNIEFALSQVSSSQKVGSTTQHSAKIQEELRTLILKRKARNEEVFEWIDKYVPETETKEASFIRALVTVVCEDTMEREDGGLCKCNLNLMKDRKSLLQKYIDVNGQLELQALYAVQALFVQLDHPPGFIKSYFDTLYDEDVITEDSFHAWESSPEEKLGKGVAIGASIEFFRWLRSASEEPTEDS